MDCTQTIRARRSIRKFKSGQAIPKADVEAMLEAAMMAPSACNSRPWEFFVVENREKINQLNAIHPSAPMLATASLAIVVCGMPQVQTGKCAGYWPLDCGAAIQNLLLQADALGYGACWCGCWPIQERVEAIQNALNTQSVPTALIALGVPDEAPAARGFYQADRVTWL